MINYDVVIIGAGAAGLMCATRAAQKGNSVLVLEKNDKIGNKILISGGGRCNFSNLDITSENYLSQNEHFCKSALSRYTQWHFIELLNKYEISYEERNLGQLFCDERSELIIEMLVSEAEKAGVDAILEQNIEKIEYSDNLYSITANEQMITCANLVIATGGSSIPKIGATDFALRIAKQFKVKNIPFSPALVPFTLMPEILQTLNKGLEGVSHKVTVSCNGISFSESMLFTHRGLSGPVILQISSYWKKGDTLSINLVGNVDVYSVLQKAKQDNSNKLLSTVISTYIPQKLADKITSLYFENKAIQTYSDKVLKQVSEFLSNWQITPASTEGMKKAEVCLGGVSTDELSSKTMQVKKQKGLYFIGEAVDVTGWLGGYNLQWAWSSGWCCGDSFEAEN